MAGRERTSSGSSKEDECVICRSKFNLINRRHSCSACNAVCCAKCCGKKIKIGNQQARVCNNCAQNLGDGDTEDLKSSAAVDKAREDAAGPRAVGTGDSLDLFAHQDEAYNPGKDSLKLFAHSGTGGSHQGGSVKGRPQPSAVPNSGLLSNQALYAGWAPELVEALPEAGPPVSPVTPRLAQRQTPASTALADVLKVDPNRLFGQPVEEVHFEPPLPSDYNPGVDSLKLFAHSTQDSLKKAHPFSTYKWFAGELSRQQAEAILIKHPIGVFLLRSSSGQFVFSVHYHSKLPQAPPFFHVKIRMEEGEFSVAEHKMFPSIPELVAFYEEHCERFFNGLPDACKWNGEALVACALT